MNLATIFKVRFLKVDLNPQNVLSGAFLKYFFFFLKCIKICFYSKTMQLSGVFAAILIKSESLPENNFKVSDFNQISGNSTEKKKN